MFTRNESTVSVAMRDQVVEYLDDKQRTYMSVIDAASVDTSSADSTLTAPSNIPEIDGVAETAGAVGGIVATGGDLLERELTSVDIVFIVYLSLVFILACLSNTTILLVFFRKSSLRTTSNRFVIQLLLVNLLCCFLLLPLVLVETLFTSVPGQCTISESVSCWLSSLSILSTLLIGGDQYLAVKFPLRYRHHVTRTRAYISQVTVLLTSTLLAVIWTIAPPPNSLWHSCKPTNSYSFEISVFLVTFCCALISYLLPVILLTIIYCKIFSEAHNNSARTRRSSTNPVENLYSLTSTLIAPLTIAQVDLCERSRTSSVRESCKKINNGSASPTIKSEAVLERKGSSLYRSPSHIKSNMNLLRHRISNASQIMHREEGKTARLYTLTLTSILLCWSPYYLSCIIRLVPDLPVLPSWCIQLVMSPCLLYPLISSFIFACRNSKIKKELRRIFQTSRSVDELSGLPPPGNRRLARNLSGKESNLNISRASSLKEPKMKIRRFGGKEGNTLLYIKSTRSSVSSTGTCSTSTCTPTLKHNTTKEENPHGEASC